MLESALIMQSANHYMWSKLFSEHVAAEWLRRVTCKPNVRMTVGSNPVLDSLVAVRNSSPGQPEPCEGNLVAAVGSCGGLMINIRGPCWK